MEDNETSLSQKELERLVQDADDAFWEVIVRRFPQAKYGDLSPERTVRLSMAAEAAVAEWIANNVPYKEAKGGGKPSPSRSIPTKNEPAFTLAAERWVVSDSVNPDMYGGEKYLVILADPETSTGEIIADFETIPHAEKRATVMAAAPRLLKACELALDEIEQWNESMNGSDDPRTQIAIDELKSAINEAYGIAD